MRCVVSQNVFSWLVENSFKIVSVNDLIIIECDDFVLERIFKFQVNISILEMYYLTNEFYILKLNNKTIFLNIFWHFVNCLKIID